MVACKVYGPVEEIETRKIVAVANYCRLKLSHAHTKEGDENKKAFLAISPFGQFPVMETVKGAVIGSTAIAIYIAEQHLAAKLLSGDSFQMAQCISAMEACRRGMETDAEAYLAFLDVFFTSRTYLVGERLSVADVTTAVAVRTVENAKSLPIPVNVARWCRTVMSDSSVAKAMRTQAAVASPKKIGASPAKKKEAASSMVPSAAPVPPTKMEKTIQELPPTNFPMEDWKRFYSNSKDLKGEAMTHLFENVDREGYTFWKVRYDKMEGECNLDYLTSNLLNGFIQSMPLDARKFGFGVFDVVEEAGGFNYEGVLMLRGDGNMPGFMFEHRSFEYHFFDKLNLDVEADKQYIIECFCHDEGETLGGKKINCGKQFK